jgi:hypothetical protein
VYSEYSSRYSSYEIVPSSSLAEAIAFCVTEVSFVSFAAVDTRKVEQKVMIARQRATALLNFVAINGSSCFVFACTSRRDG